MTALESRVCSVLPLLVARCKWSADWCSGRDEREGEVSEGASREAKKKQKREREEINMGIEHKHGQIGAVRK